MNLANPRTLTTRQVFYVLIVLLTLIAGIELGARFQHNNAAIGCDGFGYARQAELFREKGFFGGLSTAIREPQASLLIQLSKQSMPNSNGWYEPIAPHCHHYQASRGKVILQYPMGTGLLLSLFPADVAMPYLQFAGSAVVALCVLMLCVRRRLDSSSLLLVSAAVAFLFSVLSLDETHMSASVPATLLLIPVVTILGRRALQRPGYVTLLIGIVCGFFVTVRIANVFLLAGLVVQELMLAQPWTTARARAYAKPAAIAVAGFFLGFLPQLIANSKSTRSAFASTYGLGDTTPPVISVDMLLKNVTYYFSTTSSLVSILVASAFIAFGMSRWIDSERRYFPAGTAGAALQLIISSAYFLTHPILVPYYPISACTFAVFMVAVEAAYQGERLKLGWALAMVAPIIPLCVHYASFVEPFRLDVKIPKEILDPEAVVWADITSGTLYYEKDRYAAKLNFANRFTQKALVDQVAASGHKQYFVLDSDAMKKVCELQASLHGVVYAGEVLSFYPSPAWRLASPGEPSQANCSRP